MISKFASRDRITLNCMIYGFPEPIEQTSSTEVFEYVERHIGISPAAAAREDAISPSGCANRWNAVGEKPRGIEHYH